MNIDYIRNHIITPTLVELDSYSDDRADMVLVTGAAESLYHHVIQVNGPARSWFQMELKIQWYCWSTCLG